jgi:hypothetical protein
LNGNAIIGIDGRHRSIQKTPVSYKARRTGQAYPHKAKVRSFSVEPGIMQMRNKLTFTPQQSSVYDYSASVAKAVEWLGDRYLLAKSINMRRPAQQLPMNTLKRPGYNSQFDPDVSTNTILQ